MGRERIHSLEPGSNSQMALRIVLSTDTQIQQSTPQETSHLNQSWLGSYSDFAKMCSRSSFLALLPPEEIKIVLSNVVKVDCLLQEYTGDHKAKADDDWPLHTTQRGPSHGSTARVSGQYAQSCAKDKGRKSSCEHISNTMFRLLAISAKAAS